MDIKIKSLVLRNFKGIKSLAISDLENEVIISGRNETGKTTIMDSVLWLLFGKDSTGRKDFNIKTLDKDGEPIHRLEHEVSADLLVDDETITLKKIYKEKWTKPRGKAEAEFMGHTTEHYFNDVPLAERDYNAKIATICPEQLFKLLTNPLAFPSLPWQEERKILFDIAGNISDEEIAGSNPAFTELMEEINGKKTFDEYKREIAMKKKRIREKLDAIPARIDEAQRAIPTVQEDWKTIEKAIDDKGAEIKSIDKEISDISASMNKEYEAYRTKQTEINNKRIRLTNIENDEARKVREKHYEANVKQADLNSRLKNTNRDIDQLKRLIQGSREEAEGYQKDLTEMREEWKRLNGAKLVFNEDDFACPTCKRYFEEGYVNDLKEQMTKAFNENKLKRLVKNVADGKKKAGLIKFCEETIELHQEALSKLIKVAEDLKKELYNMNPLTLEEHALDMELVMKDNVEYHRLLTEIKALQKEIGTEPKKADISQQTARKEEINKELKDLIQRLNQKEFTKRAVMRINELIDRQKDLSQIMSEFEKIEYNVMNFIRAKVEAIEGKVNRLFKTVRFKFFETQINGELNEVCMATVDGVPYSDINNAAQINAGLDIISALSDYYNVYAPTWVDNSEAVNELLPIKSQTIKLYVTEDPILKIISNN